MPDEIDALIAEATECDVSDSIPDEMFYVLAEHLRALARAAIKHGRVTLARDVMESMKEQIVLVGGDKAARVVLDGLCEIAKEDA